ncbi:hypothetical protein EON64_10640 [archaeon]|nr:MAG: hypothetical protein EON64_10640 [archaeon]
MSDPVDPMVTYLHKAEHEIQSHTVKTTDDRFKLSSAKKMLAFLEYVPEKYKTGPWSPAAHLALYGIGCFVVLTLQDAMDTYEPHDYAKSPPWLQAFRLIAGLYGIAHIIFTFQQLGVWPFVSYTLTSWNLMTLRLLAAYLAGTGWTAWVPLANLTRFPALVMNTVTVVVWWLVLVPLIDYLLRSNRRERAFFWTFNLSAPLLNVHLLNLPLVALDFLHSGQKLRFFDLHVAVCVALGYSVFYLTVLDPLGLHFYLILTPRSRLCLLSYGLILGGYCALFHLWNSLL